MKRANIIIIILYGILLIGLVYFYFFYMPQFDDEPPILNFYNQENLGFNLRDLFIISLISPIVGFFVFGILLSYIFCYIIERKFIRKVFKKKQNDKKAVKEIEYIEANKTENIFKEALFASVFAFNISYQILKIPNLVNIFVNNEYYLGEVNPLIYSYFAILPIMMMVSSA